MIQERIARYQSSGSSELRFNLLAVCRNQREHCKKQLAGVPLCKRVFVCVGVVCKWCVCVLCACVYARECVCMCVWSKKSVRLSVGE